MSRTETEGLKEVEEKDNRYSRISDIRDRMSVSVDVDVDADVDMDVDVGVGEYRAIPAVTTQDSMECGSVC